MAPRNYSFMDIVEGVSDAVYPEGVGARDMSPEPDAADLAASSPRRGDAVRSPTALYVSPEPEDAARAATALYVSPEPEDAARAATALRVSPGPAEDNREGTLLYRTAAAQREERASSLPYVSPALPAVQPVSLMARLRRLARRFVPY